MSDPVSTFIYGLCDPRVGELRYIGKADDLKVRLGKHIRNARRATRPKRNAWIRGLLNDGVRPEIFPLASVPYERWEQFEVRFIAHYRSIGCDLLNETDGGTGGRTRGTGYRRSRRERQATHKGLVAFWASDESDELRQKIVEEQTERWADPEYRAMNLERQRAVDTKERRRRAQLKRWENPEEKARQAEVGRRNWADPEMREKMLQRQADVREEQDYKEKRSRAMKKAWETRRRKRAEQNG